MQNTRQSFDAFLQSTDKQCQYNDSWINNPTPVFRKIKFDGVITFFDMFKNPIFSESSQGNHSIFRRFLENLLLDMDSDDFHNIIKEMCTFSNGYVVHNKKKYQLFSERIFVNMKYIGSNPTNANITFETVKFEVFDEDNYETSFSIRTSIVNKLKELLEITKLQTQIQHKLLGVFA